MINTERLRERLAEEGLDAALLTHPPSLRWACGFTGSNGLLIVREDAVHFVTDGRYREQAAREVSAAEVHAPGYELLGYAEEKGLFGSAHSVFFQADRVPVARFRTLREHFPAVEWVEADGLLEPLVACKTDEEIAHVRCAQRVTDAVFDELLATIRPGMTEREVASQIVFRHLKRGAERMAFDPIVAAGAHGALPHARPTDKEVEAGDLVVIDMGGVVDGYASDMTRAVAIGEPGVEARKVYQIVRDAQEAALEAAHAGMTGKALDAVARGVIEDAGYGACFSHSLGHGIGLETHEWPKVSYRVEHVLPEGATVTIEPGVYLPGRFGVRIEDVVALHADGCENLTSAPKELVVL